MSHDGGVTSSQKTEHVFLMRVTPAWSKGALELGGSIASAIVGHRADGKSWRGWNQTVGKPDLLGRMRISA
jgi:hypothetical protein